MISIRQYFAAAALALLALPAAAADLCGSTPVVDGNFSEIEWAGAERFGVPVNTPEGNVVAGEIWITNDTENIYVAIRHRYTGVTTNSATVNFDANHSDQVDMGDDAVVVNWSPWYASAYDDFYGLDTCPSCGYVDTDHGGTNDVVVAGSTGNGWHVTELSHPFTGADRRDLRASAGEYIAFKLFNRIFNADGRIADTEYPTACPNFLHYRLRNCGMQQR